MTVKLAKQITKIIFHATFLVFAFVSIAGTLLLNNAAAINDAFNIPTQLGGSSANGNMYFDTKFDSLEEVNDASKKIIQETVEEGAVLLKNAKSDDGYALPLSEGDGVNLYGFGSYYTVHTGQGSSSATNALGDRVTLFEGLKNAGLTVNEELNSWYKNQGWQNAVVQRLKSGTSINFIGHSGQEAQVTVKDYAWSKLPLAKDNKAAAGIMVLSRTSGEALDMYMDTTMDDGNTRVVLSREHNNDPSLGDGDSLLLSENEKSVLLGMKALKDEGKLDKIIVLMNSASAFQCKFIDDEAYGIDAAMWIGLIGTTGANAIGNILVGKVNPSGRITDTFWAESKYNPVYYNFGSVGYENSGELINYFSNMSYHNNKYYVVYQEGIYNGYRYTETRYEDVLMHRPNAGSFDYSAVVSYPFGYGLSYSEFVYSDLQVKYNGDKDAYEVSLNVTNVSEVDGKEVVQVYLQKPYTEKDIKNGIEKSAVELVGFTKVEVKSKATVTVEIEVERKYFAAYDSNAEKTYVIGSDNSEDEYLITVAKDAHDAENNILRYKVESGKSVDLDKIVASSARGDGEAALVWSEKISYDAKTYSTNEFIQNQNKFFSASYAGEQANYGVNKITNQFDDTDFKKAGIFKGEETEQKYISRNDWVGTYGKRIKLTANSKLATAQKSPALEKDDIPSPRYGEASFYEDTETGNFDEIKLIYLKGKDYDDPLWNKLLDKMSWDETCTLLQEGYRFTKAVESIAAPGTSQQNGALAPVQNRNAVTPQSGFGGFAKSDEDKAKKPPVFACNGLVAATFNVDLIERIGEQTGEEAAWAGYNGIYGLGVNIHRGAYCGRTFEYYSEDGFLTGMAAGYEAVGVHKLGVFVLMKHAVLNDQETHRAGINVWANEQTIREIYSRAIEIAVDIDKKYTPAPILGVMTGMNRLGAKWTGGQGFCNTVLKAEYGMRGYVVSDYNSSRLYMSPIQGVLNGNDLPDGTPANNGSDKDGNNLNFSAYYSGYGSLAQAMRLAAKSILYTVVNSNAMNGMTGNSEVKNITPVWQTVASISMRVCVVLLVWGTVMFVLVRCFEIYANSCEKSLAAKMKREKTDREE